MLEYPGSLHCHSEYSNVKIRDSTNKLTDLIDYAIQLGHTVLAITEHDCVSGYIKAENYYSKLKKENPDLDFKLILGNEIYLCRNGLNKDNFQSGVDKYFHHIVLAKDSIGNQQIRELSTRAWERAYDYRGRRVPTYYSDLQEIIGSNPGHVIGSTACLGSYIDKLLLDYRDTQDINYYNQAISWCRFMRDIYGSNDFYLEMQPSIYDEQKFVNEQLLKISQELNIPYIITLDAHYLSKEDRPIHKAYLNSQDGDRETDSFYATTYMMNTQELESYIQYFDKNILQTAYQNILDIKNKCEIYSLKQELKIPQLKWIIPEVKTIEKDWFNKIPYLKTFYESDFIGDNILARAIIQKIQNNDEFLNQQTYDAIQDNLERTWLSSIANKTHWSAYYLNLQNIIKECWNAGTLVGPGRGSGVGFILLYILGITQINPLREETATFPWRFLNPSRVSVLDVDVDIEGGRREQVLDHLRQVYGQDRISNVITFAVEKSKAAIQTAARGLGIEVDEAQYLSSLIPEERGQIWSLSDTFYGNKDLGRTPVSLFVKEMTNNYPELWRVAQKIEGLVCRTGIHAGGIIFTDEPFTNSTGLMRAPDGTIVTAFDLHDAEAVSLIKMDLLSIEALDNLHTCLDLLTENKQIKPEATLKSTYEKIIGIYNIERKDPKLWNLIQNHKVQSLFQMEKQSGIQGIAIAKPKSVNDLAVLNSVIRLMPSEKGAEQPLQTWARYRRDINIWYREMRQYGLTEDEIEFLAHNSAITDGICESQEGQFYKAR